MARVLGGFRENSLPDIRHSELIKSWNQTNLVEENEMPLKKDKNTIKVAFKPFEIKTIRISTDKKFPVKEKYFYSY